MSGDDLTFASVGPSGIVHFARCEPCMYGSHYPTPTRHTWAGPEDVAFAAEVGQPDPTDLRCACPCVDDPAFCEAHRYPEPEVVEVVSLGAEPCGLCGEQGACGYDAEGRPMIHATDEDEDQP